MSSGARNAAAPLTHDVSANAPPPAPAVQPLMERAGAPAVLGKAFALAAPAALQAAPESIAVSAPAVRATGCSDPEILCLGEVATAQATGAPLLTGFRLRRIQWVAPDGTVPRMWDIDTNVEVDTYLLPTAGPFAQVGTWTARTITNRGGGVAVATFEVHAPSLPSVDLALSMGGPTQVSADTVATYTLTLTNHGPDPAANVVLVNRVPFYTTLDAVGSTPTGFTCTAPNAGEAGEIECVGASLAANAEAVFTFNFKVDSGVRDGSVIFNVAKTGSSTNEPNKANNVAYLSGKSAPPAPCELDLNTCPGDISDTVTGGAGGKNVDFVRPTATGSCTIDEGEEGGEAQVVSCSREPGDFFPVGTTAVTCAAPSGDSCTFNVTITSDSASITLNGNSLFIHECSSNFIDPGANAVNQMGESLPVTVTGTVNVGTPGDYVLTYTATDGTTTLTTTRTVRVTDTAAPVISIEGANPMNAASCGGSFVDPGATARDACAGEVAVTSSGTVDTNTPGTYTITYTATDGVRTATATRTVFVGSGEFDPPTITLNGAQNMTAECGSFTDPGATAVDSCGVSVPVTVSGTVDASTPGSYTLTYSATANGNTAEVTRTVTVVDTTAPVITPVSGPATVECGTAYTDPGATATDACEGDLTSGVSSTGSVDTSTPGTYVIDYSVTDAAGNTATAQRTVQVVDTTAPVVTPNAGNDTVECHTSYTDPGASATDSCAGSTPVTASGSVDTNVPGTYVITYTATDPSGNVGTATRNVTVVDTTAPVITRNGAAVVTHECHTSYTDAGATAADSCDTSVAVVSSGTVDVNVPGTYTITYNATDDSGNAATPVTRTVNVVDTTAPVVSCPADIVVTLAPNTTATSMAVSFPAPTATDSCDASVPVTTTHASGSVFNVGTTTVTATATDDSGNSSSCSFNVTVLFQFAGFFSPIDNNALNQANGGRTIPIKFSLSGNKGLGIFADGYPVSQQIACGSETINDVQEATTDSNSGLTYSPDQYHYNWKTMGAWAGTCRELIVKLDDGSTHTARFKFK